jgi:hypothetical protein
MLLKFDRSGRIPFLIILVLAMCCFSVVVYFLWSIAFDDNDNYLMYNQQEGSFETRSARPGTKGIISTLTRVTTTTSSSTTKKLTDLRLHRYYGLFNKNDCGFVDSTARRIVNGKVAKLMANPWMAVLYHYFNDTKTIGPNCAGSLISGE